MFERFTDRARRVVVLAQEEARLLNHNYIGTEHILLGLIHEGEGVAAKALESLGISLEAVRRFPEAGIPTLGVCLGHQCIGHTFGGNVIVNHRMMHGKTSPIRHNGKDLFEGMPNPFEATRYHSLVIERSSLPACLEITAETDEGEIMGVKHKTLPVWGVQFHPESILTESGRTILRNFLKLR